MVFRIVSGSKRKAQLRVIKKFRTKKSAQNKAKELRNLTGFKLKVIEVKKKTLQ